MKKAHLLLASFLILTTLLSCEKNEILETNLENIEADYTTKKAYMVKLPIKVSDDFHWGICGHPLDYSSNIYREVDLDYQLELLKEHQIDSYRFGIRINPITNLPTPELIDRLNELIQISNNKEIKLLPVLRIDNQINGFKTVQDHFNRGATFASTFFAEYGDYFDVYTLGNELDHDFIYRDGNGDPVNDGTLPEHYNLHMLERVAAFQRGLISQISLADSSAKVMLSTTGSTYVGFLEYLLNEEELLFDIIGYHKYKKANSGFNILEPLTELGGENIISYYNTHFNKDIWITEINRRYGSYQETEGDTQKEVVNSFINEIDLNNCEDCHSIKAFYVYELLDSSHHDDQKKANHGIMDHISGTEFEYKPVSNLLKFRIEETKYGYEDYVYNFFETWEIGFVSSDEIPNLAAAFKSLKENGQSQNPQSEFLEEIIAKSYPKFIKEIYFQLFNTEINPNELTDWKNLMISGTTREEVIIEMISGPEFWAAAGGDNLGLVDLIFEELFEEHDESIVGLNKLFLLYAFNDVTHADRWLIVKNHVLTNEFYRTKFIIAQFMDILDRVSEEDIIEQEANYIQALLGELNNNLTHQGLVNKFLLSNEYWKRSIRKGYERKNPDYIGTMKIFPY